MLPLGLSCIVHGLPPPSRHAEEILRGILQSYGMIHGTTGFAPEILCLQEVASVKGGEILAHGLRQNGYPYVYQRPFGESGVLVASKEPLVERAPYFQVYRRQSGDDQWIHKGFWRLEGRRVVVYGTHLQSGESRGAREVRVAQLGELREAMRRFRDVGREDKPVFLLGDLNIDGLHEATSLDSLELQKDWILQTQTPPTRGDQQLDYIVTTQPLACTYQTVLWFPQISDHALLCKRFQWESPKKEQQKRKRGRRGCSTRCSSSFKPGPREARHLNRRTRSPDHLCASGDPEI